MYPFISVMKLTLHIWRRLCALFFICLCVMTIQGQELKPDSDNVVTNSFWDNWYFQVGMVNDHFSVRSFKI